MLKRVSQKLNHMMLPPSVGAVPGKPMLDFMLGIAILKDRKISPNYKCQAALCGGLITMFLAQVELLLCHVLHVGPGHSGFLVHSTAYVAGMALFTVMSAIRLTPCEDVTRLRYARNGVIPVRVKERRS